MLGLYVSSSEVPKKGCALKQELDAFIQSGSAFSKLGGRSLCHLLTALGCFQYRGDKGISGESESFPTDTLEDSLFSLSLEQ